MPRFVLLEHRWNGVHWDFMLEIAPGGMLRTWAIDAEIVAGRSLPARALGDHRSEYLDYEGEVSGGRGAVRRIDRGEYTVEIWTPERVRARLAGGQLAGLVELRAIGTGGSGVGPSETSSCSWTFRLGNFD